MKEGKSECWKSEFQVPIPFSHLPEVCCGLISFLCLCFWFSFVFTVCLFKVSTNQVLEPLKSLPEQKIHSIGIAGCGQMPPQPPFRRKISVAFYFYFCSLHFSIDSVFSWLSFIETFAVSNRHCFLAWLLLKCNFLPIDLRSLTFTFILC